jgi:predicted phosphodiesterase
MNKLIIIISFLLAGNHLFAQNQEYFKSEIETDKKPWTNLNFYNDPDNFQFVIVTDRNGGNRPLIFEDAVSKINALYPEFVLSVGDLINGYTLDTAQIIYEWNEVNQIINELEMPFFYLPGNHDITNQVMAREWEKRYGKRYYTFIYKNTRFIILDSNDDNDFNLSREQTDFAIESIRQNTDVRWTFVLMHHPIWNYNTDGRFEEIEESLTGQNYTVLAGHTHHYYHEKRKNQNYYVLATTGAGSKLRGNHFGEFDHITWVTMTDAGPSLANLRLDGILPHDVVDNETRQLAGIMADNASLEHILLWNQGDKFTDGTLYLHFKNEGGKPLTIHLQCYHQHQLTIPKSAMKVTLNPGGKQIVEIPFSSPVPLAYEEVEAIQFDWKMVYDVPEYPDFQLSGRTNFEVAPTKTSFLFPQIPKFLNNLTVSAVHPYDDLKTVLTMRPYKESEVGESEKKSIVIDESGEVGLQLWNQKKQSTSLESRTFEETTKLQKAVKVKDPEEGLKFIYYEGIWDQMPDFDQLNPISKGIAQDFRVSDYTLRNNQFGMVFTGFILIPEDDLYIFRSASDDACRLFINKKLVINQDSFQENSMDVGAIALKKGFHPVTIHFMDRIGRERIRLSFKKTYDPQWENLRIKEKLFH